MIALLMLALLQGRPPTVGDTIWVTRRVAVPRGQSVRPAEWELTGEVELLGRPRLALGSGTAEVAYPLVAWTPGSHTVTIPGPLLLAPSGTVDSLPPSDTTFVVASVLPAGAPDTSLRPQPVAGLVHRHTVSWRPLAALLALAALVLAPVHWWWRRRRKPAAAPPREPAVEPPLARWAEAGESRTVLAVASARLRRAIALRMPAAHPGLDTPAVVAALGGAPPGWPVSDIAATLEALDAARFAGVAPEGALEPEAALALFTHSMELASAVSGADAPA